MLGQPKHGAVLVERGAPELIVNFASANRRAKAPASLRSAGAFQKLYAGAGLFLYLCVFAADGRTAAASPDFPALRVQLAAAPTNVVLLVTAGERAHNLAGGGDDAVIPEGEAWLKQALELQPTNALARALLGSLTVIKARGEFWPNVQLRHVRAGNALLDEAVAAAPDDPRVRSLRAFNNAHQPAFLGRKDILRDDLPWLWERIQAGTDGLDTHARQETALRWGEVLRDDGRREEARAVWTVGAAFAPDTDFARRMQAGLAKLPPPDGSPNR